MSYSIFYITGGYGKHVASTGAIARYKNKFPDENIVIICAYPETFIHNPNVYRVYPIGTAPYFYDTYVNGKDSKIFAHEPYNHPTHIYKQKHLIETWCELFNISDAPNIGPEIHANMVEKEIASGLMPQTNKPILIFQPFGGNTPNTPYCWSRDMHPEFAQAIVDKYKDDWTILHICHKHHPVLRDVARFDEVIQKNILSCMLLQSDKRILIDSSLQHAAAAFQLPSTVQWVTTDPKVFGYSLHTNVGPNCSSLKGSIDSLFFDFSFQGVIHECPYTDPSQIFNIDNF